MTFSPNFEKALHFIANMDSEPPFVHGQPLRHSNSPDPTLYIPVSFIKCGTLWWADCVTADAPQGPTYIIPCDWLYDPYPLLGERGRLTVTGEFLRVIDGGLA